MVINIYILIYNYLSICLLYVSLLQREQDFVQVTAVSMVPTTVLGLQKVFSKHSLIKKKHALFPATCKMQFRSDLMVKPTPLLLWCSPCT